MTGGRPGCTVVTLVRNEAPYLLEWVAWYRLIGADRLMVYDNASTDAGPAILAALAEAGAAEVHRWPDRPGRAPQLDIYADAIGRCGTEWIGFLDIDEFAVLPRDGTLPALLARMPAECGALVLNQRVIGTNGQMSHQPGLVHERFPRGSDETLGFNRWVKTIARRSCLAAPGCHYPVLAHGATLMADGGEVAIEDGQLAPRVCHRVAYYNHFVLKSVEEFLRKRARGRGLLAPDAPDRSAKYSDGFFRAHDVALHADPTAASLLPALRDEVARLAGIVARAGVALPAAGEYPA